jgi:rhodanese-related sulfurtransferase
MLAKRRMLPAVLFLALITALTVSCAARSESRRSSSGEITAISAQELQQMLETKDFLFVNVHVPYEGEIPGTDVHIPYNQIRDFAELLPEEKDAKIVQYCRSAGMTKTSGQTLLEMGYTNIYELDGGFIAWQSAGYELLDLR